MPRCAARPAGVVPIPERALDGLAEFEREGGLSRRNLLAGGVGLLLAANGIPGLSTRGVLEAAAAQAADAPDAPILVSLYLDGGNDGLNTLVPLADPRYRELRSRIGIDPATALPLGDYPGFGWHPEPGRAARALRRRQGRRAAGGRLRPPGPVALQLGRLLAQRHRRAGARPQRLARAHARRDRVARQPAAGHPRRLGPGSVDDQPPRAGRDGVLARRLRLLHPGRLGGEGVPPDLPPALAGPREAPGPGRRALDVRQHDRDPRPPRAAGQGGEAGSAAAALPRHATSASRSATSGACSARASARASRRSRRAASTRTTPRPRRTPSCCRTSATRCAPGRPTSTRAGSRSACSR